MARQIEFYFDFPSPYSYLATTQFPALMSATGAEIADTETVMNDPSVKMVFIASATRTLNDLVIARELGQRQLRVPSHSPDATRFIRDVGAPAREAISRFPAPARAQVIDRLNRGQGQSIAKTLFPGG